MKRVFYTISILLSSAVLLAQSSKILPPKAVLPIPSPAQMKWHEMEMNAFIHFTTNTFTDKEWGYGDESEKVFNPTSLDANQWARTLKETGLKTIILTCKHHDGFCLWPSKYTEHSVKNSPYKNGKGDVVREASDAAKKIRAEVWRLSLTLGQEPCGLWHTFLHYLLSQSAKGTIYSIWTCFRNVV